MTKHSHGVQMPLETKRHIAEVAKTSTMTRKELAARFNTSTRTLYRIIKEMESVDRPADTHTTKIVGVDTPLKFVNKHIMHVFGLMHLKTLSLKDELEKVNLQTNIDPNSDSLECAFNWHSTPQGAVFWRQFDAFTKSNPFRVDLNSIKINKLGKELLEGLAQIEYILGNWYVPLKLKSTRRILYTVDRIYGTKTTDTYIQECVRRVNMLTKVERVVITNELGMSALFDIKTSDFPIQNSDKFGTQLICKLSSDVDWFDIIKKVNRELKKVDIGKVDIVLGELSDITSTRYKQRHVGLVLAATIAAYELNIYDVTYHNLEQILELIDPILAKEFNIHQCINTWLNAFNIQGVRVTKLVQYAIDNHIQMKSSLFTTFVGCDYSVYKQILREVIDIFDPESTCIYKILKNRFSGLHPDMSLKSALREEFKYSLEHGKDFKFDQLFPNVFDLSDCKYGNKFWVEVWKYRPKLNKPNSYVITPSNINFVYGDQSYTAGKSNPNFDKIVESVMNGDYNHAIELMDFVTPIVEYIGDETVIKNGDLYYCGIKIKSSMVDRILEAMGNGDKEKTENYVKFFERLMENPDKDVIERLFDFLEAADIEIDKDGYIIAFKRVTTDYKDFYTNTIDNSIGQVVKMPRYMVDSDSSIPCAAGLHVCSKPYLIHYHGGQGVVISCKFNPRDVCAVPDGHNHTKLRLCKYKVLQNI